MSINFLKHQFMTGFRRLKKSFWSSSQLRVEKNEYCFVISFGIGDAYWVLANLGEFVKRHPKSVFSVVFTNPRHAQLLQLFPCLVPRRVICRSDLDLSSFDSNFFGTGRPLLVHPSAFMPEATLSLLGYKGFTLRDVYKLLLNIPLSATESVPVVPTEARRMAMKKFAELKLKEGRTVLIAPFAQSISGHFVSDSFWKDIVATYNTRGFDVVFNDVNNWGAAVQLSLLETIPFVELCGYFVGVRSGLCDLLISAKAKKIVLYPEMKWYSGSLKSGSTLSNPGGEHDLVELVVTGTNDIDLKNSIFAGAK